MKRLMLLVVLTNLLLSCGNNTEKILDYPTIDAKTFYFEDGYKKQVKVKLTNLTVNTTNEIDNNTLENIAYKSLYGAKHKIKNKLTYVPKELTILSKDGGGYNTSVTFRGKNSMGVEFELKGYWVFNDKGELIEDLGVQD